METERRNFLKTVVKTLSFLVVSAASVVAVLSLYPFWSRERTIVYFKLMPEVDLPRRGVKRVDLRYERGEREMSERIFIVNEGGTLTAITSVCSHLGCLVNYNRFENVFLCPCHGGKYNIMGEVVGGPPPRRLRRMPVKIDNGMVYIGVTV